METLKRYINEDETLFDGIVILIIGFLYYLSDFPQQSVVNVFNADLGFFFLFLIQYTMSYQIIRFFKCYHEESEWIAMLALVILSVAIYFSLVLLPVVCMLQLGILPRYLAAAAILPGLFIVYANVVKAMKPESTRTGELWRSVLLPVILISYLLIKLMEWVDSAKVLGASFRDHIAFVIMLIQLFILFPYVFKVSDRIEAWYDKNIKKIFIKPGASPVGTAGFNIIIALLSAVGLTAYQSLIIEARPDFMTFGASCFAQLLSLMIVSGFIPYRLLWAFAPPRKTASVAGAFIMFGIYIYSLI